jgi:hypothetical protein
MYLLTQQRQEQIWYHLPKEQMMRLKLLLHPLQKVHFW